MLDGMPKRVPEIQNCSPARLQLVIRDNLSFDLAGPLHGIRNCMRVFRKQGIHVCLQPCEKRLVRYRAVFHHFGQTRSKLTIWQGGECLCIYQDNLWLVKCADQILSLRVIDTGLTADGRIDLCQQRCRDLYERDTAHVASSCEARDITHHAAPQRDNRYVTPGSCLDEPVEYATCGLDVLEFFTIGKLKHVYRATIEISLELLQIQWRNRLITDDQTVFSSDVFGQVETTAEQSLPDNNRIAPITEFDGYCMVRGHADRVPETSRPWAAPTGGRGSLLLLL